MPDIVTIGLDPAKRSGISAFRGPHLVHSTFVISRAEDPTPKIVALREALASADVPTSRGGRVAPGRRVAFVAEAQHLPKNDPDRFTSAVRVASADAVWEALARLLGLVVVDPVHPSSWQSLVGVAGPGWSERRFDELAEITSRRLGLQLGLAGKDRDKPDEDRLAAVFIGLHGHMRELGWRGNSDRPCEGLEWVLEERNLRRAPKGVARRRRKRDGSKTV